MPRKEIYYFSAPFIHCSSCNLLIPVSYGELPRIARGQLSGTGPEDQIVLPPDEWKAAFGCQGCGHVNNCTPDRVFDITDRLGDAMGYHDSATLFSATFQCGKMHCKAPTTMYANIENGGAPKYLQLLSSGFFHGPLPCDHDITALPKKFYRIERITGRLW